MALALSVGLLAGCTANEPLAEAGGNYTSADGAISEIAPANRDEPVTFSTANTTDSAPLSMAALRGRVVVVNFWYASCPPCRAEAPTLAAIANEYERDVRFIGINVYDDVAVARSFEDSFDIPYPSALDVETGEIRLAFAGSLPPNAVPTTLVLDREGRVAARISGAIMDDSILTGIIDSVLDEDSP